MTWFAENKEKLEEEFPLLKESELVIAAMKKYKLTSSNNSLISNDTQVCLFFSNNEIQTQTFVHTVFYCRKASLHLQVKVMNQKSGKLVGLMMKIIARKSPIHCRNLNHFHSNLALKYF